MDFALFAITYLILIISVINFFTIRRPNSATPISESVTVLLPVRNEEKNITECLNALEDQIGVADLRIIIINDQSTDKTSELIEIELGRNSNFSTINTQGPQDGWLGKVSALQAGFMQCNSKILITLDADVRLEPHAITMAVNQLNNLHLDFTSPYPQQISGSFIEKLIQPLLHWSWMSTIVLRLVEKFPRSSTAVANGQFFLVRRSALESIEGFTSVQNKVLDDIELARSLISAGFKGVVTEGSYIAKTRMYSNIHEIRQGYGKSLHQAFGGILGTLLATFFIFLTGVLPILLALSGSIIAWLSYFCIVFTRLLSAIRSRSNPMYALLHPLSSLLLIYLIAYSWRNKGEIQWKGRTV